MLKEQYPYIDAYGNEHKNLIKQYSSNGCYIIKNGTGEPLTEAVDVYPCRYTYTETEGPIPPEPTPQED